MCPEISDISQPELMQLTNASIGCSMDSSEKSPYVECTESATV